MGADRSPQSMHPGLATERGNADWLAEDEYVADTYDRRPDEADDAGFLSGRSVSESATEERARSIEKQFGGLT
jgi:hypothetical protein